MKQLFTLFLLCTLNFTLFTNTAYAIENPTAVPNNPYGIHIISATKDELEPAKKLVNTNGDWGYVTFLIESKDRNEDKWKQFFDELRRSHIIPIVRIATAAEGNYWKKPTDDEAQAWADFLDKLNWPVKNRYIVIYNEPNHATEWGNSVDAGNYAQVLNKTIDTLKAKNPDFFVLNAGFDASAPDKRPAYADELKFLKEMNDTVPGIFEKLDGWSSHSYPNPDFIASPNDTGRGSVRTFEWEMQTLKKEFKVQKDLPIFITETGWKNSDGKQYLRNLPSPETVAKNYKTAFDNAWRNNQIVAVTPFLLNYQEPPFDHFSFKKMAKDSPKPSATSNSEQDPNYQPAYHTLRDAQKPSGRPIQEYKAKAIKNTFYRSIVVGEIYDVTITVRNTGQSIWNEYDQVTLIPAQGARDLGLTPVSIPPETKVEPGGEYTFTLPLSATKQGNYSVSFQLFAGERSFDSEVFDFRTEAKPPVVIQVETDLKWNKNPAGNYLVTMAGLAKEMVKNVAIGEDGKSKQLEARYLLPDYTYDFTIEKPFYKPKTIRQTIRSGQNTVDFGELQPDISSAILHPKELWGVLPWSGN